MENKMSYFVATSSNALDISGQPSPYTIPFHEQQDCLCEYVNDTTFVPKCKGYYKFNLSVTAINNSVSSQSITVALVVDGVQKAVSTENVGASFQRTFNLNQSIYLNKGNNVYVTIQPTTSITLTNRSFNGSKCGRSSCSCSSCHSSCSCSSCH
jgi:hypothetical protein